MPIFHKHMCPKCYEYTSCKQDCKIELRLGVTVQGRERGANANCAKCGPDDPRPADLTELAKLVAIELHNHNIWARVGTCTPNNAVVEIPHVTLIGELIWFPEFVAGYSAERFDRLGPIACAKLIRQEELQRIRKWAGDVVAKVK